MSLHYNVDGQELLSIVTQKISSTGGMLGIAESDTVM